MRLAEVDDMGLKAPITAATEDMCLSGAVRLTAEEEVSHFVRVF